jgi:hypothetical protein
VHVGSSQVLILVDGLDFGATHVSVGDAAWRGCSPRDDDSVFVPTFIKAIRRLEREGAVAPDLTFHGLRHMVGTLLVEAGFDIDTVRRRHGQKTLAMAIHYSETADTAERRAGALVRFDPLGSKSRTQLSNAREKLSNARRQDFSKSLILMVPRGGIEPPTLRFSVACSTN